MHALITLIKQNFLILHCLSQADSCHKSLMFPYEDNSQIL